MNQTDHGVFSFSLSHNHAQKGNPSSSFLLENIAIFKYLGPVW